MSRFVPLFLGMAMFLAIPSVAEAGGDLKPAHPECHEKGIQREQYAEFPTPLPLYEKKESLWEDLKYRAMQQGGFNLVATIIFLCAIIHTFIAGYFMEMSHKQNEKHQKKIRKEGRRGADKPHEDAVDDVSLKANFLHFMGEVEVVFGLWVLALAGAVLWFFGLSEGSLMQGVDQLQRYLGKDVHYTEPIFVVIIMAIAATRPVIRFSEKIVDGVARIFGGSPAAFWFSALTITPLLGSLITEPAAMTISAMLLSRKFYDLNRSPVFAYATLGLLFVNVSVGGTLTHFAAPPVLMIAKTWDWGMGFMFTNYGWKAVTGILLANALYFLIFRKQFAGLKNLAGVRDKHMPLRWAEREDPIPHWITAVHLAFLVWTVFTLHFPPLFIGGFLVLVGFAQATGHHQNEVNLKMPVLVGFFLAALVIHGRCQAWWIDSTLACLSTEFSDVLSRWLLMIGATVLTAFNDNAAITFLASQAPGLPMASKYAVLAGAVTGGGLTVIANAPNPAGQSLLGRHFKGGISPLKLAAGALIPTIIMGACFMFLKSPGMSGADPKEKTRIEHCSGAGHSAPSEGH